MPIASAIGMAVAIYGLARFFVAGPSGQAFRLARPAPDARPSLGSFRPRAAFGRAGDGIPQFIGTVRFAAGHILTPGKILADISTPERRGRMIWRFIRAVFYSRSVLVPCRVGILATHFGLAGPLPGLWYRLLAGHGGGLVRGEGNQGPSASSRQPATRRRFPSCGCRPSFQARRILLVSIDSLTNEWLPGPAACSQFR